MMNILIIGYCIIDRRRYNNQWRLAPALGLEANATVTLMNDFGDLAVVSITYLCLPRTGKAMIEVCGQKNGLPKPGWPIAVPIMEPNDAIKWTAKKLSRKLVRTILAVEADPVRVHANIAGENFKDMPMATDVDEWSQHVLGSRVIDGDGFHVTASLMTDQRELQLQVHPYNQDSIGKLIGSLAAEQGLPVLVQGSKIRFIGSPAESLKKLPWIISQIKASQPSWYVKPTGEEPPTETADPAEPVVPSLELKS